MSVLDQWETPEADPGEYDETEREMPYISRIDGSEDLIPKPPIGWWCMLSYSTVAPVHPLDTICWKLAVEEVQFAEKKQFGKGNHMVVRKPSGERVLVVAPALMEFADDTINELNAHRNGDASYCGGWETLDRKVQVRAALVWAKRAWPKVPLKDRFRLLDNFGMDKALAFVPGADVLDDLTEAGDLYAVCVDATDADPLKHYRAALAQLG